MFTIEKINPEAYAETLDFSDNLFHEALGHTPKSQDRYHVKTGEGMEDFDIVFLDNTYDIEPFDAYPSFVKPPFMAEFYWYDENDKDTLYLDFFDGLKDMYFETLNEYTIVLTKIVLQFTDMEIYAHDPRIFWFVGETPRIHIEEQFLPDIDPKVSFYIQEQFKSGMDDGNFNRVSSTYAFFNIFFLQWILGGKKFSDYKYITFSIDNVGGIASLLSYYKRYDGAFSKYGLKFVGSNKEYFGKYRREFVEQYFDADLWPEDANEENTLVVQNIVIMAKAALIQRAPVRLDTSVIQSSFKAEMDEYFDAVLGGKKSLGVLIRASDYVSTGMGGDRKMAPAEQMIPTIRKWMDEYGYEKIFLATEDREVLKKMKKEFGKSMVALSQERFAASDFKEGQVISDLEKEKHVDDYYEKISDTTINYFYAIYILSKCNGFICSGQCNGYDAVLSLNNNKYERYYKFDIGVNGDPITQEWKEIRPVTAGMFARGAYPTSKAFYMTYRFDLSENVDPEAVRKAWDSTIKIYPYMSYAVTIRRKILYLTENPLPFVIKETGEVIEPFGKEGNYHTVTFCYLGKTLYIYVDHVPVDGTGFMKCLETFFYHYYCNLDGKEYAVPEGVFTEKDGVVPGQDVDGYLNADPVDPRMLMAGFKGEGKVFNLPENPKAGTYVSRLDCRGYCLSVPSESFMSYVKANNASPMSVLAVLASKALERVHPENKDLIKVMSPVSIRNVMGNTNSLLHQVVHAMYSIDPQKFNDSDDAALFAEYRAFLKGFSSEQSIRTVSGVYRGICEGYAKAFEFNALDRVTEDSRNSVDVSLGMVSYLGTLKTAEYGNRIRMTAFHVMQEKGIMIQVTEVGDHFYIDWYQGFHEADYIKALRDIFAEVGIEGLYLERVE